MHAGLLSTPRCCVQRLSHRPHSNPSTIDPCTRIDAHGEALATHGGNDKAGLPKTALLVASAALVSSRVVRNKHFDARVVVRQCRRASYHQKCTGIAGSRGVRFSSPTEPDINNWCGCNL